MEELRNYRIFKFKEFFFFQIPKSVIPLLCTESEDQKGYEDQKDFEAQQVSGNDRT